MKNNWSKNLRNKFIYPTGLISLLILMTVFFKVSFHEKSTSSNISITSIQEKVVFFNLHDLETESNSPNDDASLPESEPDETGQKEAKEDQQEESIDLSLLLHTRDLLKFKSIACSFSSFHTLLERRQNIHFYILYHSWKYFI